MAEDKVRLKVASNSFEGDGQKASASRPSDAYVKVGRRSAKVTELSPEMLKVRLEKIERIKKKIAQGKYHIPGTELLKALFS